MTGSLDGAQKYASPRRTSQSSGYEPMSAPAAAISVTTVLDLTILCSGALPFSLSMKTNHPVSHGQPLGPRGLRTHGASAHNASNATPHTISSVPRRPIEVTQ